MVKQISEQSSRLTDPTKNLAGHFLLALPGLKTPDLQQSIILIGQHDENGAMGVVINQPIRGIHMADIGVRLSDDADGDDDSDNTPDPDSIPLFWGGSTEVNRGFMVHTPEISWPATVQVNDDIAITAHWDILGSHRDDEKIWPKAYRMILGHVAWSPGQLEKEWMQQEWLLLPYQNSFLFDIDPEQQWEALMASQGIHPMTLAPVQARA
jgi:putative transcriptional regulator